MGEFLQLLGLITLFVILLAIVGFIMYLITKITLYIKKPEPKVKRINNIIHTLYIDGYYLDTKMVHDEEGICLKEVWAVNKTNIV